MRDALGYVFPFVQQEIKNNVSEDTNLKGFHVSSNGYYGFQPLRRTDEKEEDCEYMDTQTNDFQVLVNNYISPKERLSSVAEVQDIRGPVSRKRHIHEGASEFKKRRKNDETRNSTKSKQQLEQHLKSSDDDLLETLLRETHGCTTYHWEADHI